MEPSTRQYLAQLLMGAGQGITQASQGRPAGQPGPSFGGMLGGASTGIAAQMQRYKQEQLMAENAKREQDRFEQRLALQQQGLDQTGAYQEGRLLSADAERKRKIAAAEVKRKRDDTEWNWKVNNANRDFRQRDRIANSRPRSLKSVWAVDPKTGQTVRVPESVAVEGGYGKPPTTGITLVNPPRAKAGYDQKPVLGEDGSVTGYQERIIPGGSADRKLGALGAKFLRQKSESKMALARMTAGVQRAKSQVSKWTSGWGGLLKYLPATDARALKSTLTQLASSGGLKALDGIRQSSPTGGALGSVSNFEQEILQSIYGVIDQETTGDELLRALDRFQQNIVDAHVKTNADFDIDASAGIFGTELEARYKQSPPPQIPTGGFNPGNGWKVERQ